MLDIDKLILGHQSFIFSILTEEMKDLQEGELTHMMNRVSILMIRRHGMNGTSIVNSVIQGTHLKLRLDIIISMFGKIKQNLKRGDITLICLDHIGAGEKS